MRRTMALLATGILLVSACGRDEDTATGDSESADTGTSDAGGAGSAGTDGGDASGSITVWAMGTEGSELGVLADAFMAEHPDIDVEVTAIPWDAAHDRIVNAIAAGEVPDVSLVGTTWMGEFATLGGLAPTPDSIDPSAFFEGAWDTTVVDGVSYGVPWYVETRLVYYRTDLAEQGGVTATPEDWDGLKAARPCDAGGGCRVRHQPAARRHRLVADVDALLLAGRRRGHGRRR